MSLIIPPRALRLVRGIRDSIPPDSVIGRSGGSSDGPAHVISLRDLAKGMVSGGFVSAPSNLSEQLDALFGSSEGSLIQRGPSVWQGLAPGSVHQILMSGGASALNSWQSLSAWLDAAAGNTAGRFLFRTAGGWVSAAMTGDVTVNSSLVATLANSGVSAGTYSSAKITVDAKGRITAITQDTTGSNPLIYPQGRLTLQSNFSIMNADQVGVSTVYYCSYLSNLVPISNGAGWDYVPISGGQASMGLDAVTPHVAANNLYDIFAIKNGGVVALCIGPAWSNTATITVTIASPAVVSWTGHGLPEGAPVVFATTGALPTGITAGTTYFVGRSPGTNSFNIATSIANAAAGTFVNTSGTQSGTHTGTNGTTRRGTGAGTTQLSILNGIWTNAASLTHAWGGASGTTDYGPIAAGSATYLGSFFATANGQTTFQTSPSAASGGANTIVGLFNAYNYLALTTRCQDSTISWTNAATSPRPLNNNVKNRITFVDGLGLMSVLSFLRVLPSGTPAGTNYSIGTNINSTNGTPGDPSTIGGSATSITMQLVAFGSFPPQSVSATQSGLNYIQAVEWDSFGSGSVTVFSNNTPQSGGLTAQLLQ